MEPELERKAEVEETRDPEHEDGTADEIPQPALLSAGHQRAVKLPLTRVKALMKADPDVSLASQESVFIIAKATELFVETIAKDAFVYAQQNKRKTLQRKDLGTLD
ncbi:DNA polymerase epsilon subunit 4 isoform X2 [Protopterus annectens]|uniref:DNA polymerase epsilon subunit 4 isoform X2 n=1 Tax=Protopterus annectens TaxID=7888 RepID=UPI001CFB9C07|nr:DNA polymerase epsilon subunit 4 isoform X2 [Protopterus annectens]